MSMPPSIRSNEEIAIGEYGNSNPGIMKSIYRQGLSHRYGSKMQAIAGIHYNFSFPENSRVIIRVFNISGHRFPL